MDHLISRARRGENVTVEDQTYDPVALLTLFIRRSFGLFFFLAPLQCIRTLTITAMQMDVRMIEVLGRVTKGLSLQTQEIYFQSHAESFYQYLIHQPRELWIHQSVVFDYRDNKIRIYRMEFNPRTVPEVALVEIREESDFPNADSRPDDSFAAIVQRELEGREVSSCYLIGDGFDGDWMDLSLRYLCQGGRRVFQGNNLYSKGAAYGALERHAPSELSRQYVFLDTAKCKSNVGMEILRRGEDSYLALLDAGQNWYDIRTEVELYLEKDPFFQLVVTPLTPLSGSAQEAPVRGPYEVKIALDGLPDRPAGTTRLKMTMIMTDVSHLRVAVEDLGFGEIFPATHQTWINTIAI